MGRPRPDRAVRWQFERAAGEVDDHQVCGGFFVIGGVLDDLVDPGGQIVLTAGITVEDLRLADQRVIGVQAGQHIRQGVPVRNVAPAPNERDRAG
jgi:hypothetical protein